MSFVDVRFPEEYAYGAVRSDDWLTEIIATANWHEARNAPLADPRLSWDLSTTGRTREQMQGIQRFRMAFRGRLTSFAFRDLFDYQVERAAIGVGTGAQKVFQAAKPYTAGTETYLRPITKPVVSTWQVWVNGVPATGWTLDRTKGMLTFASAPADGAVIEASGEFDVPVRFAEGRLSWSAQDRSGEAGLLFFCDALGLIEVLGE